jgi:radical SAM superfamily enzyme YgiQ (UPF0313 family)
MIKPYILLLGCYELGHQPLSLASPAAFLRNAGYNVALSDLSVESFPSDEISNASLIGISTPMHTALRVGVAAARRVREINPNAHLSFYGLYAHLNADYLLGKNGSGKPPLADSILAGEYETSLLELAEALLNGKEALRLPGVRTPNFNAKPNIIRQHFQIPDRTGLPGIEKYARYVENGRDVPAGYVEASRGCLHTCRHCPVVPVYQGRFFVIPADKVLADIRQQVQAGAGHITFGDPDFLNGPGHILKIVEAMHDEYPGLTFDFTTKVEHILEKRHLLPRLHELGATFVISAFESTSDRVLKLLDKGHTVADMDVALEILKEANLPVQPTWVPFTPWTSLKDYQEFLGWIRNRGLISSVPSVQYSIRLLIPPGSWLIDLPGSKEWLGDLDAANFSYDWKHPDYRMDKLHEEVMEIVQGSPDDPFKTFAAVERLAYEIAGGQLPTISDPRIPEISPPRLTEDWFC